MRFFIALWVSKLYLFIKKCMKKGRSDRAGLLAARLCPEVLTKINKPKTVIAVTGTNGKSTVTHLIYDILKSDGKTIGFNDWNANTRAGHIRCLLDCVDIFNRPKKEIALLECDEMTSDNTFPEIKPNYIIITNLCRDSIRRNSYPEFIFNKLNEGIKMCSKATLIMNADDPISSFLGEDNKKIFVAMDKFNQDEVYENISPDFIVCPKCNTIVKYEYKHYRHIGKFKCPKCGLKSYKGDYIISNVTDKDIILNGIKYPVLSTNLFNAYNETQVVVLLKLLGYSFKFIQNAIRKITITKTRENCNIVHGIKIYYQMAKCQNGSAVSSVLENLTKFPNKKQIVFIPDEIFYIDAEETLTWMYDCDLELLNKLNLEKIIVVTRLKFDYLARLKLAGVNKNKIVVVEDYKEAHQYLDLDGKTSIYVLYDLDHRLDSIEFSKNLEARIREEVKTNEND